VRSRLHSPTRSGIQRRSIGNESELKRTSECGPDCREEDVLRVENANCGSNGKLQNAVNHSPTFCQSLPYEKGCKLAFPVSDYQTHRFRCLVRLSGIRKAVLDCGCGFFAGCEPEPDDAWSRNQIAKCFLIRIRDDQSFDTIRRVSNLYDSESRVRGLNQTIHDFTAAFLEAHSTYRYCKSSSKSTWQNCSPGQEPHPPCFFIAESALHEIDCCWLNREVWRPECNGRAGQMRSGRRRKISGD
jgi:hypothetical protein